MNMVTAYQAFKASWVQPKIGDYPEQSLSMVLRLCSRGTCFDHPELLFQTVSESRVALWVLTASLWKAATHSPAPGTARFQAELPDSSTNKDEYYKLAN